MNKMQLKFLSRSENEVFARNVVAAFALPLEPTLSELSDVKTAVSEAVTNCIVHAYEGEEDWVLVECELEGNKLHITVSDSGKGIEDISRALTPFYTSWHAGRDDEMLRRDGASRCSMKRRRCGSLLPPRKETLRQRKRSSCTIPLF